MGYHSLINEFGLTQAKVAERVGKSRSCHKLYAFYTT